MNLELFIARKIYFGGGIRQKVSSPAIRIAVAGIALGLAAMVLSVCIVVGFKKEIRDKVVGFGSHIQLTNFGNNMSYEVQPVRMTDSLAVALENNSDIKHIEVFANIPGIIKTDSDFQGVVLKGVGNDYDWTFFRQNMIEGDILHKSDTSTVNQTIISKYIADRLQLKLGDSFVTYFIQDPIKARKFVISGIYSTNFEDYDKLFIVTDIALVQRLNGWGRNQVSGIELTVKDYDRLTEIKNDLFYEMAGAHDGDGNSLYTRSIEELNPMIFSWLSLLDMNVWVIIILMLAVSGFTMISGLLIIILERTNMIGILKALGARNFRIQKVFLYISSFLILKGMLWGNVIALGICILQKLFGIIKLDPATYYVSEMPVYLNVWYIILINVGALVISMAMMIGPSYLIARISPAKSIKFE
ncbi:lipoprotein-releasing system permease protein [Dysgonomonas alginatilytica]|uniref:Lipoprotein-releasing system permease protein n=1 Tax=Dysgonomonas alginatilytica TaxID=1605892 RepID=A0A2V3PTN6_9BACT|nr:FtsX-like permease family protein [Dysgonomonas alginatilytica]PXV68949.1 lipoprotein-releasing system permease protein [Dysgonomonas alginatilytica]